MRDFKTNRRSDSDRRPQRGNGGFGRGRNDSRETTMHSATCAECGKQCKVPFKPTGDKPVFCSDCFEKKGGRSENRRDGREISRPNAAPNNKELIEIMNKVNANLEKLVVLLTPKEKKKASKKGE